MSMHNVNSNLVHVVALGGEIEESGISFRDDVVEHDIYFCPIGRGYPKEPPNYLGFRFDGRLQQIRHVESHRVTETNYAGFEPLKGKADLGEEPRWLFELGPVIKPAHEVKTGKVFRNSSTRAAIDLLLTCETIAEARDLTKARLEESGAEGE